MEVQPPEAAKAVPERVSWREIWHLQGPPKLGSFIWRTCMDLLPIYHQKPYSCQESCWWATLSEMPRARGGCHRGWRRRVTVEGDYHELVRATKSPEAKLSMVDLVIKDFQDCSISFSSPRIVCLIGTWVCHPPHFLLVETLRGMKKKKRNTGKGGRNTGSSMANHDKLTWSFFLFWTLTMKRIGKKHET